MRRFVFRMDQLPAWAFVAAGALVFGAARASRLFAMVHQSRGGLELAGLVTLAVFLGLVILAVRRRQARAWASTLHVLGALVIGNAAGIMLVWPFIPAGYNVSLAPMLRDSLASGTALAIASLPLSIACLWLSRRYGSHSFVTERRVRVIRAVWIRRFGGAQDAAES